ncbi:MAG: hypothetical protein AAB668_02545 [Patescibacteria group bacterium]
MKEKESDPETIFVVKLKLNGVHGRTGALVQKTFDAYVRAPGKADVESRLKELPGTFHIEPAILCTGDQVTREILRQAKLERFEFGFRASDEAAAPAVATEPNNYLPNCS